MTKGKARTKVQKKKGRGTWETVSEEEHEFTVPEMVEAVMEALAHNEPLGKGGWWMEQGISLERLDAGRKFETMKVGCIAELYCPNKPSKVVKAIDICADIVEDKIFDKVAEIEEALGGDDEDDDDD
jgi:hypothetical protein